MSMDADTPPAPNETMVISADITNRYEGGDVVHTTARDVTIPIPPSKSDEGAYADWETDHIFELTGTGREQGDSWYDVVITASSRPDLIAVGDEFEFGY